MSADVALVFTLVTTVVGDQHRASSNHAFTIIPVALNGIKVYLHVSIQTFAIVELLDALLAIKGKAMTDKVSHYIWMRFGTLLTVSQPLGMSVLYVGSSST